MRSPFEGMAGLRTILSPSFSPPFSPPYFSPPIFSSSLSMWPKATLKRPRDDVVAQHGAARDAHLRDDVPSSSRYCTCGRSGPGCPILLAPAEFRAARCGSFCVVTFVPAYLSFAPLSNLYPLLCFIFSYTPSRFHFRLSYLLLLFLFAFP